MDLDQRDAIEEREDAALEAQAIADILEFRSFRQLLAACLRADQAFPEAGFRAQAADAALHAVLVDQDEADRMLRRGLETQLQLCHVRMATTADHAI